MVLGYVDWAVEDGGKLSGGECHSGGRLEAMLKIITISKII
jgi:hypothetical protein